MPFDYKISNHHNLECGPLGLIRQLDSKMYHSSNGVVHLVLDEDESDILGPLGSYVNFSLVDSDENLKDWVSKDVDDPLAIDVPHLTCNAKLKYETLSDEVDVKGKLDFDDEIEVKDSCSFRWLPGVSANLIGYCNTAGEAVVCPLPSMMNYVMGLSAFDIDYHVAVMIGLSGPVPNLTDLDFETPSTMMGFKSFVTSSPGVISAIDKGSSPFEVCSMAYGYIRNMRRLSRDVHQSLPEGSDPNDLNAFVRSRTPFAVEAFPLEGAQQTYAERVISVFDRAARFFSVGSEKLYNFFGYNVESLPRAYSTPFSAFFAPISGPKSFAKQLAYRGAGQLLGVTMRWTAIGLSVPRYLWQTPPASLWKKIKVLPVVSVTLLAKEGIHFLSKFENWKRRSRFEEITADDGWFTSTKKGFRNFFRGKDLWLNIGIFALAGSLVKMLRA